MISTLCALSGVLLLGACSGRSDNAAKAATQVAARVNKSEISVHQINHLLQRQSGLSTDQLDAASKSALERLIDQELAVQRAKELELDRDPKVVQALEAARRDVLARAFIDSAGDTATKPGTEEIHKYYDANPALFKERRIYALQEMSVEAKPERIDDVRTKVKNARSANELTQSLEQAGYRFAGGQATKSAEQIPIGMLPQLAALRDGEALVTPTPTGAHIVYLIGSKSAPVDEATARPAIERYLAIESRRKVVAQQMKALRESARIEYVGNFAEAAATGADPAASAAEPVAGMASDALSRGVKGLR
ncbi:EpsD family peptidyl-prolyl cis-trans isomerase [Caldimonas sp. KR1-144]|uniref:EpsD family peptidyl-prolyl cis-trans isomerase n=1 Tax=Caldimonas sp. KR1-144 TaxID=3400911 RepID=UPI003C0AD216